MIIDMLEQLLGECPAGMEFLQYIFAFCIAALGLLVVAYIAHLPFEFMRNRFHK